MREPSLTHSRYDELSRFFKREQERQLNYKIFYLLFLFSTYFYSICFHGAKLRRKIKPCKIICQHHQKVVSLQRDLKRIYMDYITYKHRIAAVDNGEEIGEVTFPERNGVYVINHTYVDDRYRGQGIASELVRRAVEEIESRGGCVEATCSYALLWLARNRGCEITSPLSCPIR